MHLKSTLCASVAANLMILSAMAAAQTATPAAATTASASQELGTVVVTARRRNERLADVPIAATVETGAQLLARGALTNSQQVLEGVAGLNFSTSSTPTLSEFTIRGSGAAGTATGGDSGVGLYRNGLFSEGGLYFSHNYSRADFFDIQQVEVLRGTQGALYGRDAVGGSVNVISAKPTFDDSGRVDVNYGTTVDNLEGQLVVNKKLNDYVAVRLGFDLDDQQKGFLYDRTSGKYFDEDHGGVGRGQIRFRDDNLDMNLLYERQEEYAPSNAAQLDYVAGTAVATAGGFAGGFANPTFARDATPSASPLDINNITNIIYNASYKFSFATLSLNSSYRDVYTRTDQDVDGFSTASLAAAETIPGNTGVATSGPVDQNTALNIGVKTMAYDEEAHLAGQNDRLTWLVGGEYLRLTSKARSQQTHLVTNAYQVNATSWETWTSYAGFGTVGYDIIPKLVNITAEGRYTDDKKYQARFNFINSSYVLNPSIYHQGNFSYDVTLGYHPVKDMLAYFKVGTGYRVGGANSVPIEPAPPALVQAKILYSDETSLEYEVGLKGSPTHHTYIGIAAYQTTTDNAIVSESNGCTIALCHAIFPNFLTNGGTGNSYGLELEGKANYDVLDGHLAVSAELSKQYGTITTGPFKGFRIPQQPDWIQSFNIDYTHPFVVESQIFGNVNYRGQSGGTQDVSTPNYRLAPRNIVDLRLGVRKDSLELAGYVNNVFDKKVIDLFTPTTNLYDLGLRSAGVQLRYHW